jgi:hypothetical protein
MDSQRTGADGGGRMEDLERRLDMMELRQSAMERSRQVVNAMLPADTRKHARAAWRENLLALRSLLDNWIDRLDEKPASDAPDDGRENIPID